MQGELVVLRRRLQDLRASVHNAIDETERIRDEAFGRALQTAQRTSARQANRARVHDSLDDVFHDSFDMLIDRAAPTQSRVEDSQYTGPRDVQPRDHTRKEFGWL